MLVLFCSLRKSKASLNPLDGLIFGVSFRKASPENTIPHITTSIVKYLKVFDLHSWFRKLLNPKAAKNANMNDR